ncbi:MAG: hypothetical protein KC800_13625 [Candidatus Eremiobacteraeota bacterium]|nr:hypothetical protein [Candidatus Eremiobacteraeota bacterium]
MTTQTLRARFQGPPSLRKTAPQSQSAPEMKEAQHRQKDGVSLGKLALGLGVAAGALAGCAEMAPAEPVYQLESPEVVVLSESTQRIDLSREQNCVGFGDFKECEDVAYHPVGIHLGEGIVQDMNGNLFAAPQLVAKGAPGAASINPETLSADNSYGAKGILQQTAPGQYHMDGAIFGRADISTSPVQSRVMTPGLFKSKEHLSINGGQQEAFIREGSGEVHVVRAQGDHISVLNAQGETIAQVRHNERKGEYKVDGGFNETSVHYNKHTSILKEDGWAVGEVTRINDGSEWDNFDTKAGPHTVLQTSRDENGWSDAQSGPYGARVDYVHVGGRSLNR